MSEYVGLDVSMEETSVCVLNAAGEIVWEGKVGSSPDRLARAVRRHAPQAVKVGLETGPLSTWLWHGLREAGIAAVCLDARHAHGALSMRVNKTDRNDAVGLAQLVRMGWYREVQVKGMDAHAENALLAARALLVRQRVELEGQIRGLLKNFGLRIRATKGRAFGRAVSDLRGKLPALEGLLSALIEVWSSLRLQIAGLTQQVRAQAERDPVCRLLMSMPGVGPMTALAYRAAIDDPARFRHSASVGAYLGLTPRRYASGETDRMGRISRCGDPLVRAYLFEAANVMLSRAGKPNPLKSWGARLARRSGFKKARVALARRMAVVLHRMWRDGAEFGAAEAAV